MADKRRNVGYNVSVKSGAAKLQGGVSRTLYSYNVEGIQVKNFVSDGQDVNRHSS
jgi:hypothetical protein